MIYAQSWSSLRGGGNSILMGACARYTINCKPFQGMCSDSAHSGNSLKPLQICIFACACKVCESESACVS